MGHSRLADSLSVHCCWERVLVDDECLARVEMTSSADSSSFHASFDANIVAAIDVSDSIVSFEVFLYRVEGIFITR